MFGSLRNLCVVGLLLFAAGAVDAQTSAFENFNLGKLTLEFIVFISIGTWTGWMFGKWVGIQDLSGISHVLVLVVAWIAFVFLSIVVYGLAGMSLDASQGDSALYVIHSGFAFGMVMQFIRSRNRGDSVQENIGGSAHTPAPESRPAERRSSGSILPIEPQSAASRESDEMTDVDDLEFYSAVDKELKEGTRDDALWLKARVEADGKEPQTELAYVRFRVEMLKRAEAARRSSARDDGRKETLQERELFSAAMVGDYAGIQMLIRGGCPLDTRNENGATAVFLAAVNGHLPAVQLLLENGADATTPNDWGTTPRDAAEKAGFPSISTLLFSSSLA